MAASLAFIILAGFFADALFRRVRLPGLVGMLLVGVIVSPHVLDMLAPDMIAVSGDFRKIALIVILLRAGLELRRDSLLKVGRLRFCRKAFRRRSDPRLCLQGSGTQSPSQRERRTAQETEFDLLRGNRFLGYGRYIQGHAGPVFGNRNGGQVSGTCAHCGRNRLGQGIGG